MLKPVIVAAAVLAGGCATTRGRSLDRGAERALAGRELAVIHTDSPVFVDANKVDDPAVRIADALAADLEKKYRMVAGPVAEADAGNPGELFIARGERKLNPGGDILLDVRTAGWGFHRLFTRWTHYGLGYVAWARLVDARSNTLLAKGTCEFRSENTDDSPTYDELMEDCAARLKLELRGAAAYCVEKLEAETFGLDHFGRRGEGEDGVEAQAAALDLAPQSTGRPNTNGAPVPPERDEVCPADYSPRHHNLFIRPEMGIGYAFLLVRRDPNAYLRGGGPEFGVSIGGTWAFGDGSFVLAADAWDVDLYSPEMKSSGRTVPYGTQRLVGYGIEVVSYLASQVYLSLGLSLARVFPTRSLAADGTDELTSAWGLWERITIGKEWSLGNQWGLGVGGALAFADLGASPSVAASASVSVTYR